MNERVAELLDELVALPTVSETSNQALIELLIRHLESLGAECRVVPGAAGRANLLARLGPPVRGGLMLCAHTDVVPPGGGWATAPFRLTRVDDRLHGRGTADMKGFIATVIAALETVDPRVLSAPVHFLGSYDEEVGCRGVRDVLPLLHDDGAMAPRLVVVGEPTMMRPRHSHLGKVGVRLTVRAAEAHSSRAANSPSAIVHAARFVRALDAIQASCPVTDGAPPFVVNCGSIHGGTQTNVIAGECVVTFEVRHDTERDPDLLLEPLRAAIAESLPSLQAVGGGVDWHEVTRYPAMRTDTADDAFRAAVRIADGGPSSDLGFGTEGGLFSEALGAPVVICGPGDIADAHRPDEFVAIDQLDRSQRFVEGLVEHFCC
ncbi:MAG: acetylornithine deacetylase [Actinomycetota bacterium]